MCVCVCVELRDHCVAASKDVDVREEVAAAAWLDETEFIESLGLGRFLDRDVGA